LRIVSLAAKTPGTFIISPRPAIPFAPGKFCEIPGVEGRTANIERCCGHAGRHHVPEIDGSPGTLGKHEADPSLSGNVCDLVGIRNDRCRPVKSNEPGVFFRGKKRALDMNVGIDKAGSEIRSRKIDHGSPGIVTDPQHLSVFYWEVLCSHAQMNGLKIPAFRHTVST
jgi:hypothetical protein